MSKIIIKNNGQLLLDGDIEVFDSNQKKFDFGGRTVISFCRCGFSANKPFCDGSHAKNKFHSEIEAKTLPPKV
jgi:CDGSH-type Zn-finger protein